ncbi:MAG: hypothetical protein AAGI49_16475, partial [Bacteroidota bacterium]
MDGNTNFPYFFRQVYPLAWHYLLKIELKTKFLILFLKDPSDRNDVVLMIFGNNHHNNIIS